MGKHCDAKCVFCSRREGKTKKYFWCDFYEKKISKWQNCKERKTIEEYRLSLKPPKPKLIVLIGKSAAGKDYALSYLKNKYNFSGLVSCTTRPKRPNEKEGVDYYYITNEKFFEKLNDSQFVETREYSVVDGGEKNTWYYGVPKAEFEKPDKKICIVDNSGYGQLCDFYGKENIVSIFVEAEENLRKERAIKRGGFEEEEWERRSTSDEQVFGNAKLVNWIKNISWDYIVVNNGTKKEYEKELEKILLKEGFING